MILGKHLWHVPWLLVVLIVSGPVHGRRDDSVQITATSLCQAYKDNELASDEKFKGKTLEVSGKVRRVYETTRPKAACIELEDETSFSVLRVKCYFDPKVADALLGVQKDQKIKVSGTCEGKEPFGVKLSSSKLLDPAPERVIVKDTPKEGGTDDKPLEVKAADIARSYQTNEIAADRRFKGKVVQITGEVRRVHKKKTAACIDLMTGLKLSLLSIECQFDPKSSGELARLTKGQQVTIRGRMSGKALFDTVEIKECLLAK